MKFRTACEYVLSRSSSEALRSRHCTKAWRSAVRADVVIFPKLRASRVLLPVVDPLAASRRFAPHQGGRGGRVRRGSRHFLDASSRHSRDQASPTLEGKVVPRPVHGNDGAVAEPDEKVDVRDAPQQPSDKTVELNASELRYSALAADRGERTEVAIAERRQR